MVNESGESAAFSFTSLSSAIIFSVFIFDSPWFVLDRTALSMSSNVLHIDPQRNRVDANNFREAR